ncbi:electron transfer flavoprotein subunit alpha/FixB family protein [Anaeromyxobacter terrae]|uniref:electron transfer flavoprotein subunit alpha/FixB family protein n=1 Tax=Anaeromyxobacter terrae TaxID=2925406 RepID=UPI001F59C623|nr:electron transfer flavoprotein subunit alpha/FixB family protein [Anaeromyxobacter sp. SG22]
MSNVLVIAEQSRGTLRKATLSALTAAREVARRTGGGVSALVLGSGAGAAAEELAAHGVPVRLADAPVLAHPLAEAHAPVVAEAARAAGASWVVTAATSYGKDLLPRAAVALGAAVATEVLAIAGDGGEILLRRPMWAGNVIAEVELRTAVKAFSVRPTEFAPAARAPGGSVTPMAVAVDAASLGTRFVELQEVKSERPELTDARVVVAGGRGTKGDFGPLSALADDLGAAVGASRAAVDAGWVPNDWQVGQTGKVVAPDLYVAAGISGAIQHVAGMKGAKVIVAINKDADAPIFQIADYGLVADLFQAVPALRERLKAG